MIDNLIRLLALLLGFQVCSAQPAGPGMVMTAPGTMRIQAGSTWSPDGKSWRATSCDLDSTDADTWSANDRSVPVDVKPNGVIALRGRNGWSVGLQAVLARGAWANHRPRCLSGRAAWFPAAGESLAVRLFPEGVELFRVFTDSSRLAEYHGTILYRLTGNGMSNARSSHKSVLWDTGDGLLSIGSPLAWNDRHDSLWGELDTVRQGGKLSVRESFDPDSLAWLARGGRTVTIDPTVTVVTAQGSGCEGDMILAGLGKDYYNYGSRADISVGNDSSATTSRFRAIVSFTIPSIIHRQNVKVYSASLRMYCGSTSVSVPPITVSLMSRFNSQFVGGTTTGAAQAGSACYAYLAYNTIPWEDGRGCDSPAHIYTYTPTAATYWTIPVPTIPTYFANSKIGFLLQAPTGTITNYSVAYESFQSLTAAFRPLLTIQYTSRPQLGAMRGGMEGGF